RIAQWPGEYRACGDAWRPKGDRRRHGEVAAEHLDRRDPQPGRKIGPNVSLYAGGDVAADRYLLVCGDFAGIKISRVVKVDALRGQEACHRAVQTWQVKARATFCRLRAARKDRRGAYRRPYAENCEMTPHATIRFHYPAPEISPDFS